MPPLTYIEVCAGAGGWGLGLHRAGWSGLGVEIDADASETHRRNVGPCITGDITTLHAPHDADMVCGGVPCQPFSSAGLKGGFDDARGQLFRDLLRFGQEAHARVVVMENVRGLVHRGAVPVLYDAFARAGFPHVRHHVLNSADFGVPQNRRRVFIVGFRDAEDAARWRWPEPTHAPAGNLYGLLPWVSLGEALGIETDGGAYGRVDRAKGTAYQGMRVLDPDLTSPTVGGHTAELIRPRVTDREAVEMLERPAITVDTTGSWNEGNGRMHSKMAAALKIVNRPSPTITSREDKACAPGRLHAQGGTANARYAGDHTYTALASVGFLKTPAEAKESGGEVRLSIRQLARLQDFPDDFDFVGNNKSVHRQIGNAVPKSLGEAVGRSVRTALGG